MPRCTNPHRRLDFICLLGNDQFAYGGDEARPPLQPTQLKRMNSPFLNFLTDSILLSDASNVVGSIVYGH